MENRFEKYLTYIKENGKIVDVNVKAFELKDEALQLFKELYDTHYGSIEEDENLISIHTGGWSDNEQLIREFRETAWWFINHDISMLLGKGDCFPVKSNFIFLGINFSP